MKKEDRATISASKKSYADFEKYRAKQSAENGKVQTQDDAMKALLKGRLAAEHEIEDDECDDVYEDYVD